jgi:single-stranded DNA-binding protein
MSQEIIQYIQFKEEDNNVQSKWTDKDFVRRYQKEYRQRLKERIQLIKENKLEPTKKSEDPNYYENYKKKPKVEKIENLTEDLTEYKNKLFYHWEYYAYLSPIWKERIQKYKGYPNHSTKKIEFLNSKKTYLGNK